MFDLVKTFGGDLVEPSGIVSFLLIIGLFLLASKRHRTASRYPFTAAILIYVFFGTGPVGYWLLGSLEFRYPPFQETADNQDVEDIVLLAGYAGRDGDMPLSSHVNDSSAIRILETARVFRLQPKRRIIISGMDDVPIIMRDVLVSLGIPDKNIITERGAASTIESAINVSTMLKGKKAILVTSAGHMHRASRIFRNYGIHPIPAPTDFLTRKNHLASGYFPRPLYLRMSDLAIHEYVGILWYGYKTRK
jgi:uncharacterized SAM-binding protein YcdF (DUF218 family)